MEYRKWWVLLAMCLITVMLAIDATALNIAIPVIAAEFTASLTDMQWVVNAFFLLAAMIQILGGHLGDTYGHKKVFLFNVLLFVISSTGSGLSTNESVLIFFRALQGASVGITNPLSIALIFEAFPIKEQSYARSFVVATMGIALAAGAPLGGLFVHTIGWRWIFFINIPIGLLCFFLTLFFCREKPSEKRASIDKKSVSLLILALFSVTYGLNQVQNWGFFSLPFIGFMSAGVLFLYSLYLRERHRSNPIVDFFLFANRRFRTNNILRIIVQILFLALLFFLPLYLQNIAKETAITSGLTMLALTIIMAIVSPIAGKWVDLKGERIPNILSMALFLIASFFVLFFTIPPQFPLLSLSLFLFGIAIAIMYVSTTTGALEVASQERMGAVSGLFFTIVWLSCALGVSLCGTLIADVSRSSFALQTEKISPPLTEEQYRLGVRAARGLTPLQSLENQLPARSAQIIGRAASESFMKSIQANAWMFIALSVLGLFLSLQNYTKSKS